MACLHLMVSPVVILFSLPLVLGKVKRNGIYGIRIPESFRSEARWYQINRFGGLLFLLWGLAIGVLGIIGVSLPGDQWSKYNLVSGAIIVASLVLNAIAIFVYAACTSKD